MTHPEQNHMTEQLRRWVHRRFGAWITHSTASTAITYITECDKDGNALVRADTIAPGVTDEDPRWQKLRDLFGLDGWRDGVRGPIPNPDQIITHIEHIANERARLLFATLTPKEPT